MNNKAVEIVIVGYRPSWQKWPDTQDTNYDSVLAQRTFATYSVGGETVPAVVRLYPVHRAYTVAGMLNLPLQHPFINNLLPPPQPVLDAMVYDLECLANDGCKLLVWEHVYQCYPSVAKHLKRLFAHSTLVCGDDSPGSTEIKTQPVAGFFDSAILANVIWTEAGEKTSDLYRKLRVAESYYVALSCTGGFMEGVGEAGLLRYGGAQTGFGGPVTRPAFDLDRRIQQVRGGSYSHDVVFVGACMGRHRPKLSTAAAGDSFRAAGLRVRLHGVGMRDGELSPRDPLCLGRPVAALYLDSFSVLNLQFIGLMGTRPFDAWASGTLLVQWDPVGEMEHLGLKAGVHYAAYDGTIRGLIDTVRYYQGHLDEAEAILREGYRVGQELPVRHSIPSAIAGILEKHRDVLGW